jgi:hypothetical protein
VEGRNYCKEEICKFSMKLLWVLLVKYKNVILKEKEKTILLG